MNTNDTAIRAAIADAIAAEAALRKAIETINAEDKYALGRGPSGRLLGVMAYGHLSGVRNALAIGLSNYGAEPSRKAVTLQNGECAFVTRHGNLHKSTIDRMVERLNGYLVYKFGLKDYVARFFRHLGKRGVDETEE